MKIRITQTPPGAAPEEIRQQWVGIEIPVIPNGNQEDPNWNGTDNNGGYIVGTDDAIAALQAAGRSDAAVYWQGIKAQTGYQLRFGSEFCTVVR